MKPRSYQILGNEIKKLIQQGIYNVGDKLPSERLLCEKFNVSRTVIREAIIMLELDGLVNVKKGSGIYVVSDKELSNKPKLSQDEKFIYDIVTDLQEVGPFEMLQARQLIECAIAAFAASQVTKKDINDLNDILMSGANDINQRDSKWDRLFHHKLAEITNNSVLVSLVKIMWLGRSKNPLWLKLHEHIDESDLNEWQKEHQKIIDALVKKDTLGVYDAMWIHLESTKKSLYDASSIEQDDYDKYLFQDEPLIHLRRDNASDKMY